MGNDSEIKAVLQDLLQSQRYAVIATDDHGQPFTSLMAFVATEDLRKLVVLTERTRRKFTNLMANPNIALLIDNRENKGSDTQDSVAVTAIGQAYEAESAERALLLELFLDRHPYLATFAASPSCAIVTANISRYILVSRFEQVLEWRIKS